uniref:Uncharacterized protein n=1 Tax=Cyprinus carpio TaxID=7962 RepID=A0A8C1RAY0_CYPCA
VMCKEYSICPLLDFFCLGVDSRTALKELHAFLASVKVTVHDSTIRKKQVTAHPESIKTHLNFAKTHLGDPQIFWENIFWANELKAE